MFAPILVLSTSLALSPLIKTDFRTAIEKTEQMVWDSEIGRMVSQEGLSIVNVTWEDTGRTKNSVWGPNISDMTIGVRDPDGYLHPMPVIRFDNFNDITADLDSNDFWLRVGNERGRKLESVSLEQILRNPASFLHDPRSWTGNAKKTLWNDRDEQVLVSAQACFLPIPKSGEATFTPVIYNYQSYPGDPAVMTIVATREGTSIQVVENNNGYMSEELFFNQNGERAPFTATRLSDFIAGGGDSTTSAAEAQNDSTNVVLLIQVPLKQKNVNRYYSDYDMAPESEATMGEEKCSRSSSDVENAVIGHGEVEGPFDEINKLSIERDPQFPVRVTVQFYKATSNGIVSSQDVREIRKLIDMVYSDASYVGSLVTDGFTGRATEWVSEPKQPEPKWYGGIGWKTK